ncbi:MAG TPA: Rrf2 family transcriptional regulator [Fibrobacteraceae bacterium]|nr:Rrf2 family transcriptional regulator [Fibrobacteraceae bacterium]
MKLSTKCRYGARAILEIADNHLAGRSTKRKDITAHQGIPSSYLENILIDLRNKGLVTTERGPKGGFRLTRAPGQITMLEVIKALRGASTLQAECLEEGYNCDRMSSCITHRVWAAMQQAEDDVLRSVSLESLLKDGGKNLRFMDYVI